MDHSLVFSIFLIFTGAAVLSTVALLTRQSMLVAYMVLGVVFGPWCLKLVGDTAAVRHIGEVGIIFLLFLLGLQLPPQKLGQMLKTVSWIGVVSSLIFAAVGYAVSWLFGYQPVDCLVVAGAMVFSSTIIGIKLLPTTILHHQHTGEVMIGLLLFQDMLAIIILLVLHAASVGGLLVSEIMMVIVGFPAILIFAYLVERFVLRKLLAKFNRIKEYMFLVAIAWCLSMAQLGHFLGLSGEIGAFIAGVSLAVSPVSMYIAESLRPVRDFFLVMFFFTVGANFNLSYLPQVIIPAVIMAGILLVLKPATYRWLLGRAKEPKEVAWEVGARLGQISEFSLIIAYVALDSKVISGGAAYLIQAATILTFIVSSYWVVMRYPTPIAMSDRLRRD